MDDNGVESTSEMQITVNETRPDLRITEITLSPDEPKEGDMVTITGAIYNGGYSATKVPFLVGFYVDNQYMDYVKVTENIEPGETIYVSFEWMNSAGNHMLTLIANDIGHPVDEADFDNNQKSRPIDTGNAFFPDLKVTDFTWDVSEDSVLDWNSEITLKATIENIGSADAKDIRVAFFADDKLIGVPTVKHLSCTPGENTAVLTAKYRISKGGKHTFKVMADGPLPYIVEPDKTNNVSDFTTKELKLVYPDITLKEISLENGTDIGYGEPLYINVTVANYVYADTNSGFSLNFYADGIYIGTERCGQLKKDEEAKVRFEWKRPIPGTSVIEVIADEYNEVLEIDEDNNSFVYNLKNDLKVKLPDLFVESVESVPLSGTATFGDEITTNIRLINKGSADIVRPFTTALYVNDKFVGSFETEKVLSPGASVTGTVKWYADMLPTDPYYELTVYADVYSNLYIADRNHAKFTTTYKVEGRLNVECIASRTVQTVKDKVEYKARVTSTDEPWRPLGLNENVTAQLNLYKGEPDSQGKPVGEKVFTAPMNYNEVEGSFKLTVEPYSIGTGLLPGMYTAYITADRGMSVQEYVYRPLLLVEDYYVDIEVGKETYAVGESIEISGRVTEPDGVTPIAESEVTVVIVGEEEWRINVTTDSTGAYKHLFKLPGGFGGSYSLRAEAKVNGALKSSNSLVFYVEGLYLSAPDSKDITTGYEIDIPVNLVNVGTLPVTGLHIETVLEGETKGVKAELVEEIPDELGAGENRKLKIRLSADEEALPGDKTIRIKASSAEGYEYVAVIEVKVHAPAPVYRVDVTNLTQFFRNGDGNYIKREEIVAALRPGETVTQNITVTNIGMGAMKELKITPPKKLPWITLTTAGTDVVLPVNKGASIRDENAKAVIVVNIAPGEYVRPGVYEDVITISSNAGERKIPVKVNVGAANVGTIVLQVLDTNYAPVKDAIVKLTGPMMSNGELLAEQSIYQKVTDSSGTVRFENIPAGAYVVSAKANLYKSFEQSIDVPAVIDLIPKKIVIEKLQFSYNWSLESVRNSQTTSLEVGDYYGAVLEAQSNENSLQAQLIPNYPGIEMNFGRINKIIFGVVSIKNLSVTESVYEVQADITDADPLLPQGAVTVKYGDINDEFIKLGDFEPEEIKTILCNVDRDKFFYKAEITATKVPGEYKVKVPEEVTEENFDAWLTAMTWEYYSGQAIKKSGYDAETNTYIIRVPADSDGTYTAPDGDIQKFYGKDRSFDLNIRLRGKVLDETGDLKEKTWYIPVRIHFIPGDDVLGDKSKDDYPNIQVKEFFSGGQSLSLQRFSKNFLNKIGFEITDSPESMGSAVATFGFSQDVSMDDEMFKAGFTLYNPSEYKPIKDASFELILTNMPLDENGCLPRGARIVNSQFLIGADLYNNKSYISANVPENSSNCVSIPYIAPGDSCHIEFDVKNIPIPGIEDEGFGNVYGDVYAYIKYRFDIDGEIQEGYTKEKKFRVEPPPKLYVSCSLDKSGILEVTITNAGLGKAHNVVLGLPVIPGNNIQVIGVYKGENDWGQPSDSLEFGDIAPKQTKTLKFKVIGQGLGDWPTELPYIPVRMQTENNIVMTPLAIEVYNQANIDHLIVQLGELQENLEGTIIKIADDLARNTIGAFDFYRNMYIEMAYSASLDHIISIMHFISNINTFVGLSVKAMTAVAKNNFGVFRAVKFPDNIKKWLTSLKSNKAAKDFAITVLYESIKILTEKIVEYEAKRPSIKKELDKNLHLIDSYRDPLKFMPKKFTAGMVWTPPVDFDSSVEWKNINLFLDYHSQAEAQYNSVLEKIKDPRSNSGEAQMMAIKEAEILYQKSFEWRLQAKERLCHFIESLEKDFYSMYNSKDNALISMVLYFKRERLEFFKDLLDKYQRIIAYEKNEFENMKKYAELYTEFEGLDAEIRKIESLLKEEKTFALPKLKLLAEIITLPSMAIRNNKEYLVDVIKRLRESSVANYFKEFEVATVKNSNQFEAVRNQIPDWVKELGNIVLQERKNGTSEEQIRKMLIDKVLELQYIKLNDKEAESFIMDYIPNSPDEMELKLSQLINNSPKDRIISDLINEMNDTLYETKELLRSYSNGNKKTPAYYPAEALSKYLDILNDRISYWWMKDGKMRENLGYYKDIWIYRSIGDDLMPLKIEMKDLHESITDLNNTILYGNSLVATRINYNQLKGVHYLISMYELTFSLLGYVSPAYSGGAFVLGMAANAMGPILSEFEADLTKQELLNLDRLEIDLYDTYASASMLIHNNVQIAKSINGVFEAVDRWQKIDPPLPLEVMSVTVPDVIIQPGDIMGEGKAIICIKNMHTGTLSISPTLEIFSRKGIVSSVNTEAISIVPGETAVIEIPFEVARATLEDSGGYEAVISLDVAEPDTMTIGVVQGPYTAHFFAGTQQQVDMYRKVYKAYQPMGREIEGGERDENIITCTPGTKEIRVFLAAQPGSDLELRIYDQFGRSSGKIMGTMVNEIEGATVSQLINDQDFIRLIDPVSGPYRIEVVAPEGTTSETYTLSVLELPDLGAVPDINAEMVVLSSSKNVCFAVNAFESSGQHSIEKIEFNMSDMHDRKGNVIPGESFSFTDMNGNGLKDSVAAGEIITAYAYAELPEETPDSTYIGCLTVTVSGDNINPDLLKQVGVMSVTDSVYGWSEYRNDISNELIGYKFMIPIVISIDTSVPESPVLDPIQQPTPDKPNTVSLQGKASPKSLVSVWVDDIWIGTIQAEDDGHFVAEITLDVGSHKIYVTETKLNALNSPPSQTYTVTVEGVDSAGPQITAVSPQEGEILNIPPSDIIFIIDDSGIISENSIRVVLDGITVDSIDITNIGGDIWRIALTDYLSEGTHNVEVSAADIFGNSSSYSWSFTIQIEKDEQAPSAPQNLKVVSATDTTITLEWEVSTDNKGVEGYEVYRNGEKIGITQNTTFTDTGLVSGTAYEYTVRAFDAAGNISEKSDKLIAETTIDESPVLTAPPDITVEASGIYTTVDIGNAAIYNMPDAVIINNAPDSYPLGTTIVIWTASDTKGNVLTAEQKITVVDTTPPVLTVPGDKTVITKGEKTVVELEKAYAVDAVDGEVEVISDQPNEYPVGTTIVTFTAVDSHGNTAKKTVKVTVIKEEQKPEEQKPEEQKPEEQKPEEQKPEEQKPADSHPGGTSGGNTNPKIESDPEEYPAIKPGTEVDAGADENVLAAPVVDKERNTAIIPMSSESVKEAFEKAPVNQDGKQVVDMEVKPVEGINNYEYLLPSDIFIAQDKNKVLAIKTPSGDIELTCDMFDLKDIERSKNITINIGIADTSELSEGIKKKIGSRPVIEINIMVDGRPVEWKSKVGARVAIAYKPTAKELQKPEHIFVWYIDNNDRLVSVPNAKYNSDTGKVTFTAKHTGRFAVAFEEKTFDDLDQFKWAKKQIDALASRDIIKEVSENTFCPGAKIKRADAVVLIVRALELESEFDTNFSDVNVEDYYYRDVGIAKSLGIINGVDGINFKPEEFITRQDLMVIVKKALDAAGKNIAAGDMSELAGFEDSSNISSYAKESVAALVKQKIIVGDEGKRINPLDNINRAEVATIVYRILGFN